MTCPGECSKKVGSPYSEKEEQNASLKVRELVGTKARVQVLRSPRSTSWDLPMMLNLIFPSHLLRLEFNMALTNWIILLNRKLET